MRTQRRIRVIVNPTARSGRGARALKRSGLLDSRYEGVSLEVVESRSAEHLRDVVRASQEEDIDALGLAGGDGTVALALDALNGVNRVPIGILPSGSGNDFAAQVGVPADLAGAMTVLLHGSIRHVDVASAAPGNARYCCVATVGLDEVALGFVHRSPFPRSKALNIVSVLRALAVYRPRPVRIAWEGGAFEGEIMFAAVTNTRSYGGGFKVSPSASIDDGVLDLCVVRRTGKLRLLKLFPKVLAGTHGSMPEVLFVRSPWFRIEGLPDQLPLALDGELPRLTTPAELRCQPGALKVLTPKQEAN
jgi:diacylglycerol kinase (ATP)